MRVRSLLYTAMLVATLPTVASAQLTGSVLRLEHRYPFIGTTYAGPFSATVGAGVEFTDIISAYSVDVSDVGLRVGSFLYRDAFASGAFNGFVLFDPDNSVTDFLSVQLLGTNIAGFDASRITFDDDNIWLNFESLPFAEDSYVEVVISSTVPEPSTLLLLLACLGVLGVATGAPKRSRSRYCG
jgi:hypothetical protein